MRYHLSISLLLALTIISIGRTNNLERPSSLQGTVENDATRVDALEYAISLARKTNNEYALSEIAVRYAELGDFEQAFKVADTVRDDDDKARALSEIALQYWKQGHEELSRQLFARVASMAIPKDVIYVWGPIIDRMAEAQQFALALELAASLPESEAAATKRAALEEIVEQYISAGAKKTDLPDLLPQVLRIGKSLKEAGEEGNVIAKVAVAYTERGDFARAFRLIQGLKEDYDKENASHQVAIQLARARQYDRALQLAAKAGEYFGPMAFIQIAAEALKNGDKGKAAEIASRTLSQLLKDIKKEDEREGPAEAERMAEIAVLHSDLGQKQRAAELMDVAFKRAQAVGKPGERYTALQKVVKAYAQLGLFHQAIEAAQAFDNGNPNALAEVGAKAAEKGLNAPVSQVTRALWDMPVTEHESARVNALTSIAVQLARHNQKSEALKLLQKVAEFADARPEDENTAEALKNLAVAFAEAGDFQRAFERIQTIKRPYFVTWALLETGALWARTGQALNEQNVKLLEAIVNVKLDAPREPIRLVKEGGWEIPGLAQSRPIRPREILKTRDSTVESYRTFYEPVVQTFIQRPFERAAKEQSAGLATEGLMITMIEEHDVEGRKYCYVVTAQEVWRDEATNTRKYSTSFETFLYYDEDGDGKFETLEEGIGTLPRPRIPQWAMKETR